MTRDSRQFLPRRVGGNIDGCRRVDSATSVAARAGRYRTGSSHGGIGIGQLSVLEGVGFYWYVVSGRGPANDNLTVGLALFGLYGRRGRNCIGKSKKCLKLVVHGKILT